MPKSPTAACTLGTPQTPTLLKTVNLGHSDTTLTMPQAFPGLLQTTPTSLTINSNIFPKNSAPTSQSDDEPTLATPTAPTVPTLKPQVHPDKFLKDIDYKLWNYETGRVLTGHIDSDGEFISRDNGSWKTGLDYLHNDKDTEAVKLIGRFRMHNNGIKFKEEQIKKLAHSLTADSELKNLQEKKGSKKKKR